MDSTPVNWEALDALIIDFAQSENLIEGLLCSSSPPSSPASSSSSSSSSSLSTSSYHSRLIIWKIRRSLEAGDIDTAMDFLRAHAPSILDDRRLLFQLQKQKFIELLRKGTAEGRDAAIACLRTALAPCALDAYPEAYEEFKHVLLAFIYGKDDQASPVANEWSERRRFDIAGLMSSVLRAHLHAYDPVFSMTLRYLISIHKGYCFQQGIVSPISDLTQRLLLDERDPPATAQESLYEVPPFDEVDVQALAQAVELTRQAAVDSLRFSKGDLFVAFQNELCRTRLDVSMLDELVCEYCVYRGIMDYGVASTLVLQPKVNQPEPGWSSSRNFSLEVDSSVNKHSDGETSINMGGSPENNADVSRMQGTDVELRYACELSSNHDYCSTSGLNVSENPRVLPRYRTHGSGERGKRKRWRGRYDDQYGVPFDDCSRQELSTTTLVSSNSISKEQQGSGKHSLIDVSSRVDKYEIMLGMKDLASKGMAAEVVEEVTAMDPSFFVQNPILLFKIMQVEFLKLVSSGDHSSALRVACSHLGPLAASDPALLKPLKETLLALLQPNEDVLGKGLPLHALSTSLQVAIGRRFDIEEPRLMKVMKVSLYSHDEWFKLQMCKDRFESHLRIDSLKEVNTPLLTSVGMSNLNGATSTLGSSQVTISSGTKISEDGSSPNQVSPRDVVCDENAILKVMVRCGYIEFLALPRADAIHLLALYNGNAEMVIQQLFA
ncbi:uncharacterized protein LOC122296389 isoform X1 [Carya illinoinensis]|uniref:uncharacterized protein LOC122296389 isoform X1 n=1 Tax=Carya illinoinensis TaxID=32201 RepID=UPI001C72226D|nr:uncharacterized protein LOC122296389 isoform X1 [Carya illinoinensis]